MWWAARRRRADDAAGGERRGRRSLLVGGSVLVLLDEWERLRCGCCRRWMAGGLSRGPCGVVAVAVVVVEERSGARTEGSASAEQAWATG